jgi:uncharacterized membrane protein YgaE (UPF0421/DUF939 family)
MSRPKPLRDAWSSRLPSILFAIKSALAAGAAWGLVHLWLDAEAAALAMISSVIVVQVTSWQTVRKSIERVIGVLLGVSLAIMVAHYLGLSFWTIGLLVLLAQVVAMFLGDRRQYLATQIPISAALSLVLGATVGGSTTGLAVSYPLLRLVGALAGGLIGTVISLLLSPPVYVFRARDAIATLTAQVAEGQRELAGGVGGRLSQDEVNAIYTHMRRLERRVDSARQAYSLGVDSARLNPWAVRSRVMLETYPHLLAALDRMVRQMRRIAYTIAEPELQWPEMVAYQQWPHDYADVLNNMGSVLDSTSAAVRAPAKRRPSDQVDLVTDMDRVARRIESCQAQLAQEPASSSSGSAIAEISSGNRRAARGSVLTDLRRMLGGVRDAVKATGTEQGGA